MPMPGTIPGQYFVMRWMKPMQRWLKRADSAAANRPGDGATQQANDEYQ